MAEIEIDGKKVEAEPGSMVIEAADKIGIWIPRFCYHKKLSVAANCRMCLVDVEKSPKPLPACATPITAGMKIYTRSDKALKAQRAVMEFLLINHPLDCPICDQGGECELQDIAMGYGSAVSQYKEGKRSIKDQNLGPLISTDMTRCIQCTRCVRFGAEVSGLRELGATGRGEHMEIGTFIEHNVNSEVSGNIIDLCPVGALTSKPFRFKARAWELKQSESISPHDCMGTNIYVHSRRSEGQMEVIRVVPRENEGINEVWISDRDRFSYTGLYHERLETPKIKMEGEWRTVSWDECLAFVADGIKDCLEKFGPRAVAALASPNLTCEEFYLLQKFFRGLGSDQIDHRLRFGDFHHQDNFPIYPNSGISFSDLENQSQVLLIGSDLRNEQPLLNLRLRKMQLASKKIFVINPVDFEFNFDLTQKMIVPAGDLLSGVALLTKAILDIKQSGQEMSDESKKVVGEGLLNYLKTLHPDPVHHQFAKELCSGEKTSILLGALALSQANASKLILLAHVISNLTGASFGLLTEGANAAGAWIAGCIPHRLPGGEPIAITLNPSKDFSAGNYQSWKNLKFMLLAGLEPDLDCGNGMRAMEALAAVPFITAITAYESDSLKAVANVLLPMSAFTESSGTFVNAEGRWQPFAANVPPLAESRPAWKILRVLGNLFDLEGFEFNSSEEVLSELFEKQTRVAGQKGFPSFRAWAQDSKEFLESFQSREKSTNNGAGKSMESKRKEMHSLTRIAPVPLYNSDPICRRSSPLQKTLQSHIVARLHPEIASQLKLKSGDSAKFMNKSFEESEEGLQNDSFDSYLSREPSTVASLPSVTLKIVLDERVPKTSVVIPRAAKETLLLGAPDAEIVIEPDFSQEMKGRR